METHTHTRLLHSQPVSQLCSGKYFFHFFHLFKPHLRSVPLKHTDGSSRSNPAFIILHTGCMLVGPKYRVNKTSGVVLKYQTCVEVQKHCRRRRKSGESWIKIFDCNKVQETVFFCTSDWASASIFFQSYFVLDSLLYSRFSERRATSCQFCVTFKIITSFTFTPADVSSASSCGSPSNWDVAAEPTGFVVGLSARKRGRQRKRTRRALWVL